MTPLRNAWLERQMSSVNHEMRAEKSRGAEQALSRPRASADDIPQHTPRLNALFGEIDELVTATSLHR